MIGVGGAMNPLMASAAQCSEIALIETERLIVRPWPEVVSVQALRIRLGSAATLACKAITAVNRLRKLHPVTLFVKALAFGGCSALPCGILRTGNSTADSERFRLWANDNAVFPHGFHKAGACHSTFGGHAIDGPALLCVFDLQPLAMFVWSVLAIVARRIGLPFAVFANPAHGYAATALAERWMPGRLIGWLTGMSHVGFRTRPRANASACERIDNATNGYSKARGYVASAGKGTVKAVRLIQIARHLALFVGQLAACFTFWHTAIISHDGALVK